MTCDSPASSASPSASWAWDSAQSVLLAVAAVVLAVAFLAVERRAAEPVIPLVLTSRLAAVRADLEGPDWGVADSLWWNLPEWRKMQLHLAAAAGRYYPFLNDPKAFKPDYTRTLLTEWEFDTKLKPEYGFPLYAGWLGAISDAFEKVHRGLSIQCPVLSMHSDEADVVLNWRHIAKWSRLLGSKVTVMAFPGAWHDLILSPGRIREEVFTQLFAWAERAEALAA